MVPAVGSLSLNSPTYSKFCCGLTWKGDFSDGDHRSAIIIKLDRLPHTPCNPCILCYAEVFLNGKRNHSWLAENWLCICLELDIKLKILKAT